MIPSPGSSALPPLPDLPASPQGDSAGGAQGGMAALVSGLAPIKSAVDSIIGACKQIVQSGAIPGAEQPCGQIISLATSLLPMAAQQALQPMGGIPAPGAPAPQGVQ